MSLPPYTYGIELELEAGADRIEDVGLPYSEVAALYRRQLRRDPSQEAERLAGVLNRAGLRARATKLIAGRTSAWRVHAEYAGGLEFNSPVMEGEDGLERLHRAVRVLADAGCQPADEYGLHVHVGAGDLRLREVQGVLDLADHLDPVLRSLLPRHRAVSDFAKRLEPDALAAALAARSWDAFYSAVGTSRDRALNVRALQRHGTLEFRLPASTLDGDTVEVWTRIALGLVERGRHGWFWPVDTAADPMCTLLGLRPVRPVRRWVLDAWRAAA